MMNIFKNKVHINKHTHYICKDCLKNIVISPGFFNTYSYKISSRCECCDKTSDKMYVFNDVKFKNAINEIKLNSI